MSRIEQARRLCLELGGPGVDLWTLPSAACDRAAQIGRPLAECALDVVSGFLATRARRGDIEARQRLLGLWRAVVLRWCIGTAARSANPEDAAHDVLVRAAQNLQRLNEPDGFRRWLWAITWRVLREHERSGRLWRGRSLDDVEMAAPGPAVEDHLIRSERITQIRAILQALPLSERTLLWHAYADGRTRAQIADITGLPMGTLNRRLSRARRNFEREAVRRDLAPVARDKRCGP